MIDGQDIAERFHGTDKCIVCGEHAVSVDVCRKCGCKVLYGEDTIFVRGLHGGMVGLYAGSSPAWICIFLYELHLLRERLVR